MGHSNQSLSNIYKSHHLENDRGGVSIMKDDRALLLKKHVGQGKKVLDIGCRDGALTSSYHAGNEVLGIDIDDIALNKAKESLGIETQNIDLNQDWELPKDSFDNVVAGEVLEHLYFPEKVIARAAEVLKDNGVFLGSVPNAFNLKNRIRLFFARKENTPLADPTHISHFAHNELKELLGKFFKEVEIIPVGRRAGLDKLWPGMFSFDLFFVAKNKKR